MKADKDINYFGIKAVSDSKTSDDAFTAAADSAVAALSRCSPRLFSCRRLSCLPHTDNAENGSYWPLWLPSAAYRDLKDEIRLLHRLFGHFMKALPGLETVYDVFDDFEAQRHGATPFDELGNRIAAVFGSDESAALFGKFVDNACRRGILAPCGKEQWRFNRHWAVTRRGRPLKMTKKAAFDLLSVLFDIIARRCGTSHKIK